MAVLLLIVFVLGYILITLENPVKIDKAGTALLTGAICWVILSFGIEYMPASSENPMISTDPGSFIHHSLFEHIGKIAEILFSFFFTSLLTSAHMMMAVVRLSRTADNINVVSEIIHNNLIKLVV